MTRIARLAAGALLLSAVWAGAAPAGEGPTAESPTVSISRSIPDLHLSINEVPGETSVRWPRGRIDSSLGRSLLHREPDAADFRAGFSIRLD